MLGARCSELQHAQRVDIHGGPAPDLGALQRHLESCGLAKPKWPEQMRIVEDFPRTASGKIKKFTLRDALRAEAKSNR